MTSKNLIQKFNELGSIEIQTLTNDTYETMLEIFNTYPNKWFEQGHFVKVLNKSNPFINHQLHKLLKQHLVVRQGSKRKYFYQKVQ